jgi:hypothetical protein
MSYVPLAKDSRPNLKWFWYPKGNPYRDFVLLILPTAKIPILNRVW